MKTETWLESIDRRGFDEWDRNLLVSEAQKTVFRGDAPAGFDVPGGGRFVDLGFERLGLADAELDELRLAFVGTGVAVPGMPYRLRHVRPGRSLVEPADGSERATLPVHWRDAILVADS